MFAPTLFENSRPDGFPVLEVVAGEPDTPDPQRRFVPLRHSELRGTVTGPLAALQLAQVFQYRREECDRVLEACYRFPLPGDAAVTGVWVRFGEVEIRTELKERAQANQEYEAALRSGRQAALASRESPDVFTLRLAGIRPDEEVRVETSFVQLARPEAAGWSLRIPLTTAPRYVREDEAGSRYAAGQPLALLRDPGHRFSLNLRLPGDVQVESPTHVLAISQERGWTRVQLGAGEVLPDRDCLLRWRDPDLQRATGRVLLHRDAGADATYFLGLVRTPVSASGMERVPREVTLLVDHSGSMGGAKWEAADWAVQTFLRSLGPADRFSLGLFHDSARWYSTSPVAATPEAVERAIRFLLESRESGGTNLGVALEQALHAARAEGDPTRHVLVITDAEVSDSARVLRLADAEARRADRRRISVLCIDAAPNAFLAHELAERGGGVARFLTSDPAAEDITTALEEILADWASPVLAGLRLEVTAPAEAAGRQCRPLSDGTTSVDLGDLPPGRALWVAGRTRNGSYLSEFRLRGRGWDTEAALPSESVDLPALKALFGARRVLGLEYLIQSSYQGEPLRDALARLGYDPASVLAPASGAERVYAENARVATSEALHRLLVHESLEFGVASMETAFVAVRTEAGRQVEGTVVVANALPHGWEYGFAAGGPAVMLAAAAPMPSAAPPAARFQQLADPSGANACSLNEYTPSLFAAPGALDVDVPAFLRRKSAAATPEGPLYRGAPALEGGITCLFDGAAGQLGVPDSGTVAALDVCWTAGVPAAGTLSPELLVLLYVGDLAMPAARIRVVDLLRSGGSRPLNLRLHAGDAVRLELSGPPHGAPLPELEVRLRFR